MRARKKIGRKKRRKGGKNTKEREYMEKSKKKKKISFTNCIDRLVHVPPLEVIKLSCGASLCRCVTRPKEVQCGSSMTQNHTSSYSPSSFWQGFL